jgi:hypothetical protein
VRKSAEPPAETTDAEQGPSGHALEDSLASLNRTLEDRRRTAIIQLPLWPEPKRGTPNSFLRSSLFAAIQGKDRQYLTLQNMASLNGINVKYTGQQLDQSDLDVWEQSIHLARLHPLGDTCHFSAHRFLKAIGRDTGKSQHEWLHGVITRLTACAVEISHDGKTYFGPLIKSGIKDEKSKQYRLELNRELIRLFGENLWTAVEWAQRQQLNRQPLAAWLHGFLSTHRKPHALKLQTLATLSGSRNVQAASFKRQILKALDRLKEIGFLANYSINRDLVSVNRVLQKLEDKAQQ